MEGADAKRPASERSVVGWPQEGEAAPYYFDYIHQVAARISLG